MTTAPARTTRPPHDTATRPSPRPQATRFLQALDATRMGVHLAALLGGDGRCHVVDAKFEPGVRAIVLYAYGGRLIRGDVQDLEQPRTARPVVGPGVSVSIFPDDPELPVLPELVDPARLGLVLAELAPALGGADRRWARRCRISLLRYRPGKRVTLLGTTGEDQLRYVVKGYHDASKAEAAAKETAELQRAAAGAGQTLRLAPVVAYVPGLRAVVSRTVTGVPLDAVTGRPGSLTTAAREAIGTAGAALADLHDTPHLASRDRVVDKELDRFVLRAAGVATLDAELAAALAALAERLMITLGTLPPMTVGTVHGDCKPSQFLVSGQAAYLLDLDHVGVSDQAGDLGTFVATVRQHAIRRDLSRRRDGAVPVADISETFLRSYRQRRASDPPAPERILWHEAVALERKALRAFARAPRSPLPAALVAAADRCLDTLLEGRS